MAIPSYDIIGDLHGCAPALRILADRLGYDEEWRHPDGRKLIFVGDLSDRGPANVEALRRVLWLVQERGAINVLGNHDDALNAWLRGEEVEIGKGMDDTLKELSAQPDFEQLRGDLRRLFDNAPLALSLDGGKLLVVHAAIEEAMIGRPITPLMRQFILNGEAVGKTPEGRTLRRDWAAEYHGAPFVVYGHTPHDEAIIRHNTVNIDTGAYRGGLLTALRWPEKELVSIPSGWRYPNL